MGFSRLRRSSNSYHSDKQEREMSNVTYRQLNRTSMCLPLRVCVRKHPAEAGSMMWPMNPEIEHTVTENVSSGGCYFFLSQELPLGTRLEMEITIPGEVADVPFARIYCRGKVIRVDHGCADRAAAEGAFGQARFGVAATIERLQEVNVESIPTPSGHATRAVIA
jgi:hypothetical protein